MVFRSVSSNSRELVALTTFMLSSVCISTAFVQMDLFPQMCGEQEYLLSHESAGVHTQCGSGCIIVVVLDSLDPKLRSGLPGVQVHH